VRSGLRPTSCKRCTERLRPTPRQPAAVRSGSAIASASSRAATPTLHGSCARGQSSRRSRRSNATLEDRIHDVVVTLDDDPGPRPGPTRACPGIAFFFAPRGFGARRGRSVNEMLVAGIGNIFLATTPSGRKSPAASRAGPSARLSASAISAFARIDLAYASRGRDRRSHLDRHRCPRGGAPGTL
jgi:hypothetical protein